MANTNILMAGMPAQGQCGVILRLESQVSYDDAPGMGMSGTSFKRFVTTSTATLETPLTSFGSPIPSPGDLGAIDQTFWTSWKAANATSDLLVRGALNG